MNDLSRIALAALVAAVVAALVVTTGIFGGPPPKVAITVGLTQVEFEGDPVCRVLTSPASPQVKRGQEVEWNITGGCKDLLGAPMYNIDDIEVRFVGTKTGCVPVANPTDTPFEPAGDPPARGQRHKHKIRGNAVEGRHCYQIAYNHGGVVTVLEDPDLDIRGK